MNRNPKFSPPICEYEEEVQENFPFKIEDIPGENVITLKRECQDEASTVKVLMPHIVSGVLVPDYDEEKLSVPLVVSVAMKSGVVLVFTCTAFPDEITIKSLSKRNPEISQDNNAYEPNFSLQKAFHMYLEVRGIEPSITSFLHEYMVDKHNKEYGKWLEEVGSAVAA